MKRQIMLLLSLGLIFALTGCEQRVKGSGTTITENRGLSEFDAIRIIGNYNVTVTVGQPAQASVTTDNNLLPYIETKARGQTLIIDAKQGYSVEPTQIPQITLAVQNLKDIGIIGSSSVKMNGIKADKFEIKIIGSGNGNFVGSARKVEIKLIGSGKISTNELITPEAEIKLVGAGNATVYAADKLTVRISGAGKIQYYGNPREVDQKISGSGEIIGIPNNVEKNPS